MATDIDNLKTRKSAILAELAALSTSTAGGKPNVTGAGTSIDHQGYKASLYAELREIQTLMTAATGAFEITSEGIV